MIAPSVLGQQRVIESALRAANVAPRTISFVEGHGTATPLGDPIEVQALTRAYASSEFGWCALGSVKSNLGHLGWASGMAGLIKTALALHHREIPPTLHFERPNPHLDLEHTPFFINTQLREWKENSLFRAGVSAFGLGGANAHVILEEAPAVDTVEAPARPTYIVPLSAHSEPALKDLALRYAEYLRENINVSIGDFCFTVGVGRHHYRIRRCLIVRNRTELLIALDDVASGDLSSPERKPGVDRVGVLFTGQGAEYGGMGFALYNGCEVFRQVMDSADEVLRRSIGRTASEALYSGHDCLNRISDIQPLVFVTQIATIALLKSWGLKVDAVMGHSLGEFAAACTAGVFSFEDALQLVCDRGRLLQSLSEDAGMAAVFADELTTRAFIDQHSLGVSIAAVNSPHNTTISGTKAAVRSACARLESLGVEVRELRVTRAGHSHLMEPILEAFEDSASQVRFRPPSVTFVSNVSGRIVSDNTITPEYWRRHLRETVRFEDGLKTLESIGVGVFIEIGATPHLIGIAAQALPHHPGPWLASMRPGENELVTLYKAVADLYELGLELDWRAIQSGYGGFVHLPRYPFQRQRFWISSPGAPPALAHQPSPHLANTRELLYEIKWKAVSADAENKGQVHNSSEGGPWVVFVDSTGFGAQVVSELVRRRIKHIVVTPGIHFEASGEDAYSINPHSEQDFRQLQDALKGHLVETVVYLWALESKSTTEQDLSVQVADILWSAINVIKLCVELGDIRPRVWCVTAEAQRVGNSDATPGLGQSSIWGLGRVSALEHPELRSSRIDLDCCDTMSANRVVEVVRSNGKELEIALREGLLYVPRLQTSNVQAKALPLASDGTVLITGGFAGLGLWTAEYLLSQGVRRFVLLGRSKPSAAAKKAVDAICELGGEVTIVEGDVTKRDQVNALIRQVKESGHHLQGVVHSAGVIDDGLIVDLTRERIAQVMGPKIQGAWNIVDALCAHGLRPDWFVLYSSATSVLGNVGQASHAAACSVLDTLANWARQRGQRCVAVNWGPWRDVGYLAKHPDVLTTLIDTGMGSISSSDGGAVLLNYIKEAPPQLAVLPNDWNKYLTQHVGEDPLFLQGVKGGDVRPNDGATLRRELAEVAPSQRNRLLTNFLLNGLAAVIGGLSRDDISPDRPLLEYGLDSLSAIRFRNHIQKHLRCELPPRIAFQHPTIRELVANLEARLSCQQASVASVNRSELVESSNPIGRLDIPFAKGGPGESIRRPLSVQQKRWLTLIREVDYGQRVVPILIHSAFEPKAFRAALRFVVARHEVLRYLYCENWAEVLPSDAVI
ncbi:MAG: SDR family NAD(P)-dependent oxidoreductase, partial [Vicinamibacterales bacterium]